MHMKPVKLLVALAVLAGGTANATSVTTVSFTTADSGTEDTAYTSLSFGGGQVVTTGYFWQSG